MPQRSRLAVIFIGSLLAGSGFAGMIAMSVDETPAAKDNSKGKGFDLTASSGPGTVVHASAHRSKAQGADDLNYVGDGGRGWKCIHFPDQNHFSHTATADWESTMQLNFDVRSDLNGKDARLLVEIKTSALFRCDGATIFLDEQELKMEWIWLGGGVPSEVTHLPLLFPAIVARDSVLGNNGGYRTVRQFLFSPGNSASNPFANVATLDTGAFIRMRWDKVAGNQVDGVTGTCDADIEVISDLTCN